MYDLHLHSTYSDGDYSPTEIVRRAAAVHVAGLSLTDHHGLWGVDEAAKAARAYGLEFIAGIEVSALRQDVVVHLLGYSRSWSRPLLDKGLQATRAGYRDRVAEMVRRCHQHGFTRVSWADIERKRSVQQSSSYVPYDVACELMEKHGLPREEARRLIVAQGACYVPYGEWALTPGEATSLIKDAGGVAILAHPGVIAHEHGVKEMWRVAEELARGGLAGIEVYHPFHHDSLQEELLKFCGQRKLLITGGSDAHHEGHFAADLGHRGVTSHFWQELISAIA